MCKRRNCWYCKLGKQHLHRCTTLFLCQKQPHQAQEGVPRKRLTCDRLSGAERTLSLTLEAMLLAVARTDPATLLVVSATAWAACSVPFFTLRAQQDRHQEWSQEWSTKLPSCPAKNHSWRSSQWCQVGKKRSCSTRIHTNACR